MEAMGRFITLLLFTLSFCLRAQTIPAPGGLLDLSQEDLSPIYRLDGLWLFTDDAGHESLLYVPGSWNDIKSTPYGTGTYSLRILLPPGLDRDLALFLPKYNQIITIRSGERILYESDNPGRDSLGFFKDLVVWNDRGEIILNVDFENFFYRLGGMHHPPYLGTYDTIIRYRNRLLIFQSLVEGVFFFLFLFSSFLYFSKYTGRSALYLGLASFSFFLRGLTTGEIPLQILVPSLPWQIPYRADYALLYLGAVLVSLFLFRFFSRPASPLNRFARFLEALGILGTLLSFLIPLSLLSRSILVVQGFGLLVFINGLSHLGGEIRKRNPDAMIITGGSLFFFGLVLLDIMNTHGSHFIPNATQKGMLFFILAQFLVLARRFGNAYLEADRLSRKLEEEVALQTRELRKLSQTDSLTGINNRRHFMELGDREVTIHHRYGHHLSLMMLDLDHFKGINDRFGHAIGDSALRHMAELCQDIIRDTDVLGRLGGEEFALILLETDLSGAKAIAERIRGGLETTSREKGENFPPMTVSIGLATLGEGETLQKLIERADALLYRAKREGRNRVVTEGEDSQRPD